ncbi:MAG: hypothetical protein H7263_07530 [Candidatus Sericytochromatia bacterium]|nr:hypothetical protein [Candidatus Sericytochromatia bacterium]
MSKESFKVHFNHVISPDILLNIFENHAEINGTVRIAIDKMLNEFIGNLGLKTVFDKLINKSVDESGYYLDIKEIAVATISIKDSNLHVLAEYRASKEWWAKPIAIIVLGKLLGDFATKVENCGIVPGFRLEIKNAMQQLRKNNHAVLNLRNLFERQTFFTGFSKVSLYDFDFTSVDTFSVDEDFVIKFDGKSLLSREEK